jgi:glyoxylase-like metal-dependent hydrolase (beta-lactamase superfamily II)
MIKRSVIHPATFKLDGGAMFGIIPKPLWAKKIEPDEYNRILMSLRVLLFESENRKVLVDTGIGGYHPDKFNNQFEISATDDPLKHILDNDLNINADDITDIVITHLHFDHVGGLTTGENGDEPIFKNATLHVHRDHYKYALSPTLRDAGSFQNHFFKPALDWYDSKKQIHWIKGEDGVLIEDGDWKLNFKISFGHTPYMMHPFDNEVIYMADLVPMDHHVHVPWVMGYDIEPGRTTVYKEKFYQMITEKDLTMIYEHDNETWGAKLNVDEKGRYRSEQKFASNKKSFIELPK